MNLRLAATLLISLSLHAQDEFPLTEESKPQPNVSKGQMLKDSYTARDGSVFPGTEREYQIYRPANLDTTKPAPFMVFQDGVIYNAPTVFDNLIAKKDLPPMIGIFIKPGVVPAANANALPRYNRSYEYDSVTDMYSRFLINEFLPAIVAKHKLNLSADPNARGIAGNSSGGICAFMVAWHRPDQFRRVFTGVGTYVGIHGADQLPVLVRKHEPKPLRVFLQSGENDNNLYCGDWWMANQMMERSLTWNGYDVNHAWGKGGHNAKHASQIFPEVLRWLWKGYPNEPVKANPRGEAKWRGYEVIGEGVWKALLALDIDITFGGELMAIAADGTGSITVGGGYRGRILRIDAEGKLQQLDDDLKNVSALAVDASGNFFATANTYEGGNFFAKLGPAGNVLFSDDTKTNGVAVANDGKVYVGSELEIMRLGKDWKLTQALLAPDQSNPDPFGDNTGSLYLPVLEQFSPFLAYPRALALSPDQTHLYVSSSEFPEIVSFQVGSDGSLVYGQLYFQLEAPANGRPMVGGLCVDTNGWLYVATSLGIQVLDQAGRVNFIIPTPKQPHDVCFGGKDLSELFIACGDTIYKRPTKAKGYISGQMAPIKPPAPKL